MALRPYALLPRQYDERKVLASTVDAWGRTLWLICPDARFPSREFGRAVPAPLSMPFDALLVISDGGRFRERILHGVAVDPTTLDALPYGGIVLHGHGRPGERNGQVFDRSGRPVRRFALGHRLLHLQADRRGNFWTGYADEGIYSDDPVSAQALVRWDSRGNTLEDLRPAELYRMVAGINALNVTDSVAWAAYWPGSPLAQKRAGEPWRIRTLPVTDPYAIAIRDEYLLLLGGHERGADASGRRGLHLCRLTGDGAVIVERSQLTWPNGDPVNRYPRPVCRGPHLYLRSRRTTRQWYVLTVPG
ncbi:hypothetical protein ABZZ17_19720 [Streptomyces sp. NPDC006512]|uniref:hypothetical protein n=1 Tax=Streptomyces sp. NPDC006512 TaxID=3154307 RepID=UPI0033AFFA39